MTRLFRIALLTGLMALLATVSSAGEFGATVVDPLGVEREYQARLDLGVDGAAITLLEADSGHHFHTAPVSGVQDAYVDRLAQSLTAPLDEPAGLDSSGRPIWRCPVTALECFYELDRACNGRYEGVVWSYFNYISGDCVGQCSDGGEVQPSCPRSHIPRG